MNQISKACVICTGHLEDVHSGQTENQPYGGTVFVADGNYGSTVFDRTMTGWSRECLIVNICDDCLKDAARRGLVLYRETRTTYNVLQSKDFDPDND
jgi:hypothetical protein